METRLMNGDGCQSGLPDIEFPPNSEGVSAWDAAEGNVEITRALENAGSAIDPERQRQMERRPFEFFHDFGQESGPADPLVESVIYMGEWQVLTNPLEGKDLRGITSSQLRNLRNTIFARHGHSFRSQDLREHYENFEWYEPQSGDVSALLTDSEKRNVAIIQEIERGIGGRDSNDSRDMRLQSPLGYTIEMGYASTGETYEFYLDSVTVYGSRVDRGTWRMADRYILIEWNTGKRERIDWLHLQNNESIHYSIDTIEGM